MKLIPASKRDSNIELLRIVLMMIIIAHHLLVHASKLETLSTGTYQKNQHTTLLLFLNSFWVIGVDAFIFISGYFGIKFRMKSLVNMLIQAIFYSLVLLAVGYLISHKTGGVRAMINSFFPISSGKWWFITSYLFLYTLSPIINKGIETLSKKEFGFILVVFMVVIHFMGLIFNPPVLGVNNGYSFINMLYIYLLGRYISMYLKGNVIEKWPVVLYALSGLVTFALVYLSLNHGNHQAITWQIFSYNNPVVLLTAIALFFAFKKLNFNSPLINYVATSVLAVYLLHSNQLTSQYLYPKFYQYILGITPPVLFVSVVAYALVMFVVCIVIEKLREFLFKPLTNMVDQKFQ